MSAVLRHYKLRCFASAARALEHFKNTVVTYDNTAASDGIGAQLQRILGCYALARLIGAKYHHTPIVRIRNKGIHPLAAADSIEHESDLLIALASDSGAELLVQRAERHRIVDFRADRNWALAGTETTPSVIEMKFPFPHLEASPNAWLALPSFPRQPKIERTPRIAIHIRRGDVGPWLPDRFTPTSYFVSLAETISRAIGPACIDVYTESSASPDLIVSQRDFAGVSSPVNLHLDSDPIEALAALRDANILVMSKSSFSFVGAVLNPHRPIIVPADFWHASPSNWISCRGPLDERLLRRELNKYFVQQN